MTTKNTLRAPRGQKAPTNHHFEEPAYCYFCEQQHDDHAGFCPKCEKSLAIPDTPGDLGAPLWPDPRGATGRRGGKTSEYNGVFRYYSKWRAEIRLNGKHHFLGDYPTPKEAARAFDNMAFYAFREGYINNPRHLNFHEHYTDMKHLPPVYDYTRRALSKLSVVRVARGLEPVAPSPHFVEGDLLVIARKPALATNNLSSTTGGT
jgi:hypothetical protein